MTETDDGSDSAGPSRRRGRVPLDDQAQRLKQLRTREREKQEDIAIALKVHVNTISQWERGIAEISVEKAELLAEHYNVPIKDVLGYEPVTEPTLVTRIIALEAALSGLATDAALQECFGQVSERVSEVHGALEPVAPRLASLESLVAAQATALDALLTTVLELQRLVQGPALPDTAGTSTQAPRAKRRPRGRSTQ